MVNISEITTPRAEKYQLMAIHGSSVNDNETLTPLGRLQLIFLISTNITHTSIFELYVAKRNLLVCSSLTIYMTDISSGLFLVISKTFQDFSATTNQLDGVNFAYFDEFNLTFTSCADPEILNKGMGVSQKFKKRGVKV